MVSTKLLRSMNGNGIFQNCTFLCFCIHSILAHFIENRYTCISSFWLNNPATTINSMTTKSNTVQTNRVLLVACKIAIFSITASNAQTMKAKMEIKTTTSTHSIKATRWNFFPLIRFISFEIQKKKKLNKYFSLETELKNAE